MKGRAVRLCLLLLAMETFSYCQVLPIYIWNRAFRIRPFFFNISTLGR